MLSIVELPESHQDLLDAANAAALTTIGPDRRPQVTAVWYLVDDGHLRVSVRTDRQKAKNLLATPTATLFLIDPNNMYRTIEVRAKAVLTPDDDYEFAGRVGAKYGADMRSFDQPGDRRWMVTLEPLHIVTR